jgi:hypothetical protein
VSVTGVVVAFAGLSMDHGWARRGMMSLLWLDLPRHTRKGQTKLPQHGTFHAHAKPGAWHPCRPWHTRKGHNKSTAAWDLPCPRKAVGVAPGTRCRPKGLVVASLHALHAMHALHCIACNAPQCKRFGVGATMQRCNEPQGGALIGGRGDRNQKAKSRRQKAEVPVSVGDNGRRRVAKHVNTDVF